MSRSNDEALRACPTCGVKDPPDMGLRDYSRWLFGVLPGRAGATDMDCVIEQHSTGRLLAFEFKPNKFVPRGQALMFDTLVAQGWDVVLIIDTKVAEDELQVSLWGYNTWTTMTLAEVKELVTSWWAFGVANRGSAFAPGHPMSVLQRRPSERRR
jgi:hypothetical protein